MNQKNQSVYDEILRTLKTLWILNQNITRIRISQKDFLSLSYEEKEILTKVVYKSGLLFELYDTTKILYKTPAKNENFLALKEYLTSEEVKNYVVENF